jgi:hypothetical protein
MIGEDCTSLDEPVKGTISAALFDKNVTADRRMSYRVMVLSITDGNNPLDTVKFRKRLGINYCSPVFSGKGTGIILLGNKDIERGGASCVKLNLFRFEPLFCCYRRFIWLPLSPLTQVLHHGR